MTIKTKILVGLACICLILTAFFWPGKEEDAYSSGVVREAEEISERETEMLAPDEVLLSPNGDIRLQTLYITRNRSVSFSGRPGAVTACASWLSWKKLMSSTVRTSIS